MPVSKKRKKKTKKKISKENYKFGYYLSNRAKKYLDDLQIELISKVLEYMDKLYIELQLNSEEYFYDTFDIHVEKLADIINKIDYLIEEELDSIIKAYINSWMSEIIKFGESFAAKSLGYIRNIIYSNRQNMFDNLYCEIFDENQTKNVLKKTVSDVLLSIEEYSYIYTEEFNDFLINLFIGKECVIDHIIMREVNKLGIQYDYKRDELFKSKNCELVYIDKYRELNKIAEENGFVYIRNNGGHGVFVNNKTKKTVIIPQGRSIGKGLSYVIQKQILSGNLSQKNINNYDELKELKEEKDIISFIDDKPHLIYNNNESNEVIKAILSLREKEILLKVEPYLKNGDSESALKILMDFNKNYPESLNILATIGGVYEAIGDKLKAIEYYKKYIDRNGEMYEAYLRIIKLLYDCGQDEEAEYYEIAMRGRFPKKISKLNNIIEEIEYWNFNISELLIEVFEKDDFNIISSNDFLEIGRSYFGVKNYKLAAKNLIKSVEKNPENLEAIELLKAIHTILLS